MERDEIRQDFGLMPGVNRAPVNSSFRDGSQHPPRGRLWVAPVCAIVGLVMALTVILAVT